MIGLYARASTDRDKTNVSTGDQEREVRNGLARVWPNEDVKIYADTDITASDPSKVRPGYLNLIADVKAGLITKIALHEASRLVRMPREQEDIIDLCESYGIQFYCHTGPIDLSTPMGRLNFRIQGAISKQEGELKAERQKRAWSGKAERGEWHSGKQTFGYDVDGNIIDAEASAIRQAYRDLLGSKSLNSVVRAWNESGFTTVQGKAWVRQTTKRALLNPTIAGMSVYQGKTVGQGQWTAIVSSDEQETLRKRLTDRSRNTNNHDLIRKHLLSHLLVCSCGGQTRADVMSRGVQVYRCYECNSSIREAVADERVIRWLGWHLGSESAYQQVRALAEGDNSERINQIHTELDSITDDEKKLSASGVSINILIDQGQKFQERRTELQTELERLSRTDGITTLVLSLVEPQRAIEGVRAWWTTDNYKTVAARFAELPLDEKRSVLRMVGTYTLNKPPHTGRLTELQMSHRVVIEPKLI